MAGFCAAGWAKSPAPRTICRGAPNSRRPVWKRRRRRWIRSPPPSNAARTAPVRPPTAAAGRPHRGGSFVRGGASGRGGHGRHQAQLDPDQRHHRRDRRDRLPDQSSGAERRGRGGAGGRGGARLRRRGVRGSRPGPAVGRGRQADQDPDHHLGPGGVARGASWSTKPARRWTAIVVKVAEMDALVSEIAASAQEQATGLSQVNTRRQPDGSGHATERRHGRTDDGGGHQPERPRRTSWRNWSNGSRRARPRLRPASTTCRKRRRPHPPGPRTRPHPGLRQRRRGGGGVGGVLTAPTLRSSPRKRGPSPFARQGAWDWRLDRTQTVERPKRWVPAFAGMSGIVRRVRSERDQIASSRSPRPKRRRWRRWRAIAGWSGVRAGSTAPPGRRPPARR